MNRVLSYPESKWRIAKKIVNLMPEHRSYVEPFFGSGAVLFNKKPSNIETINDVNDEVINLFRCVQQDPEKLKYMVSTTPYARKTYEAAFNVKAKNKYEKALYFLIRCWQGYGCRTTGGKTGWKIDIQGRENAYALQNWNNLPSAIEHTYERLKCVQIENKAALEVIRRFDFENVFMYLDPPYLLETRKSKSKQYKDEMNSDDHTLLLKTIVASKAKIMISGYQSKTYDDALQSVGWNKIELESNNSTGQRVTEVLWMNYKTKQQMKLF